MLSSKRGRDVDSRHRPCQDRSMSRASMTPCHALQLEVSLAETLPLSCPWRRRELECQSWRRLGGGGNRASRAGAYQNVHNVMSGNIQQTTTLHKRICRCWSGLQEHQIEIDRLWFFDCNARKTENNSRKTNHLTDDPKITYYPGNAEKLEIEIDQL